jgi:hypothetical protein
MCSLTACFLTLFQTDVLINPGLCYGLAFELRKAQPPAIGKQSGRPCASQKPEIRTSSTSTTRPFCKLNSAIEFIV